MIEADRPDSSVERQRRGRAMFEEVYGDVVPALPQGANSAFDLLIVEQQFAEVWSRPALSVSSRRLLIIGVLAAIRNFDTLELQFRRALQTNELSAEEIREIVIHLVTYIGTPALGDLIRVSETAIAAHGKDNESRDDRV